MKKTVTVKKQQEIHPHYRYIRRNSNNPRQILETKYFNAKEILSSFENITNSDYYSMMSDFFSDVLESRYPYISVCPGIDLIKLNFKLDRIDWEKLDGAYEQYIERRKMAQKEKKTYRGTVINISQAFNEESLLNIEGNKTRRIQTIIVSSSFFEIRIQKTRIKGSGEVRVLELNVYSYSRGGGNIPNQHIEHIKSILFGENSLLEWIGEEFGIYIAPDTLEICYLEINMNIDPIIETSEFIKKLAPFQHYLGSSFTLNACYSQKTEVEGFLIPFQQGVKPVGLSSRSRTIGVKIYDKKYEHNNNKKAIKKGDAQRIATNIARFEFTIVKKKQVERHLGTSKLSEVNNEMVIKAYKDLFTKYIFKPYYQCISKGKRELTEYFKRIDIKDKKWRQKLEEHVNMFYRKSGGGFLAFKKDDIKEFVKRIDAPSVKNNQSRICRSVEKILLPDEKEELLFEEVFKTVEKLTTFCEKLGPWDDLEYFIEYEDEDEVFSF